MGESKSPIFECIITIVNRKWDFALTNIIPKSGNLSKKFPDSFQLESNVSLSSNQYNFLHINKFNLKQHATVRKLVKSPHIICTSFLLHLTKLVHFIIPWGIGNTDTKAELASIQEGVSVSEEKEGKSTDTETLGSNFTDKSC